MFGAGLPVFALNFEALPELVIDGKNGKVFNNSEELANMILTNLENNTERIIWEDYIRDSRISWEDHWDDVAKPIFT
jgi:beta-1,4-mannosyltransferase